MCVLYKLPHLHCIFEAHPFEIVRLQSSSEGSVKEAKRSLSEGKVFGLWSSGTYRSVWEGARRPGFLGYGHFGGGVGQGTGETERLLAIFGTNENTLIEKKNQ